MRTLTYTWRAGNAEHELRLVPVPGTAGRPYLFGADPNRQPIEIRAFHMMSTPVTQALWAQVMGSNPSKRQEPRHPVENVSWDQIAGPGGFLDRINASGILAAVSGSDPTRRFRLPSETEWEYAARGGPNWTDWEWCQDTCVDDITAVPRDRTPWPGPGTERRLRGGCHHNWDIHCTVWFRYGIAQETHDGCIGFRLVLAPV